MSENLANRVGAIITNSIQEETYAEGTLQRMALRNRRLGNESLADTIDQFVKASAPQLDFFRTIKNFPATQEKGLAARLYSSARGILSHPLLKGISYHSPFEQFEGLATPERRNLHQLSGPFFVAAVGDFSEGHEWSPQNRTYLVTAINRSLPQNDIFELRVFSDTDFKAYISGKHGQHDQYTVSLSPKAHAEGSMDELFEDVVEDMARYAFGPKASGKARDAFQRAVQDYVTLRSSQSEISQLIAVEPAHAQPQAALADMPAPALSIAGTH